MTLPAMFLNRYQQLMAPAEFTAFKQSLTQPATHGFRINPLKASLSQLQESVAQPVPGIANGYYGQIQGQSIDHLAGWIYSQDPSAMNVAQLAAPQAHERVLDLCAAPGGKTTQLAALMNDQGLLVANEINHQRALVLSSNVERWGLTHTVVTNNSPEQLAQALPEFFDCIVVDAPCSGEGLFRKDPSASDYWSVDNIQFCAQRQKKILTAALTMLRPGGRLIYSTCTFTPEEDEQNLSWLLDQPQIQLLPLPALSKMDRGRPAWAQERMAVQGALRLFPHHYRGEGHFIAAVSKQGTAPSTRPAGKSLKRLSADQQQLWQQFQTTTLTGVSFKQLQPQAEVLWAPAGIFPQSQLKIIRNGLRLGQFKKKRFEPDHALVMALSPTQFQQQFDLTAEQFAHFVHGEALILKNKAYAPGWVAVSYQQKIFAWGKVVQGQLKNFLPKGLRIQ